MAWTLDALAEADLLERGQSVREMLSRRRMLRNIGLAAIPVVLAITAPHARAAVSTCSNGRAALHGQALLPWFHLHPLPDLPVIRSDAAPRRRSSRPRCAARSASRPRRSMEVSAELLHSAQVSGVEALVSRRMPTPDRRTERYQILEQSLRERRLAALFALWRRTASGPRPSRAGR